ncbi:MAG: TlyA family RNA methyltransferase [Henriciella sp.]|jgi:23S rRNA (cytidine1920-2'-O)/16S rRNA (cytidine1409-2'-O)-methyltransferase
MSSERIDKLLLARGLFDSRAAAQAAIRAGRVRVAGQTVRRSSAKVAPDAVIEAQPLHPYVSRGGVKLAHALDQFSLDPAGRHCLDIGASTGGFSEVLLLAGAASVTAVDVGRGQMHARLRGDPRLISMEGRDARSLGPADLVHPPELVVCDASFIALSKVLGVPLSLAAPEARLVCLFKPQFEVGRAHVAKGGIVRDDEAVLRARDAVVVWLDDQGWSVTAWTDSPIPGGDGNREYLFLAVPGPGPGPA